MMPGWYIPWSHVWQLNIEWRHFHWISEVHSNRSGYIFISGIEANIKSLLTKYADSKRLTEWKTRSHTGQSYRMIWVTAEAEFTKTKHDFKLPNTSLSRSQEHRSCLLYKKLYPSWLGLRKKPLESWYTNNWMRY